MQTRTMCTRQPIRHCCAGWRGRHGSRASDSATFPAAFRERNGLPSWDVRRPIEVVAPEEAIENFDKLSGGFGLELLQVFEGRLLAAGGAVRNALNPADDSWDGGDVDFWFISPAAVAGVILLFKLLWYDQVNMRGYVMSARITDKAATVYMTSRHPVAAASKPYVSLQFILRSFRSASDVIDGFDLSHIMFCFTGQRFLTNTPGLYSLAGVGVTTRVHDTDPRRWLKWARRGCHTLLTDMMRQFAEHPRPRRVLGVLKPSYYGGHILANSFGLRCLAKNHCLLRRLMLHNSRLTADLFMISSHHARLKVCLEDLLRGSSLSWVVNSHQRAVEGVISRSSIRPVQALGPPPPVILGVPPAGQDNLGDLVSCQRWYLHIA